MTLFIDTPPLESAEGTADAEALFKEARQRERRRRLRVAAAFLLVGALAASGYAATRGNGGANAGPPHTSAAQPSLAPPTGRPWAEAPVARARLATPPVALPGTPYAYSIVVASTSPISRYGRLARIDLVTGRIARGPVLSSSAQLFTIGHTIAVLSPRRVPRRGGVVGPFRLQLVRAESTALTNGVAVQVPAPNSPIVATSNPPLRSHGLWIGVKDALRLIDTKTGAVLRTVTFDAAVMSVSLDPTGQLLYADIDEMIAHPTARFTTVIAKLDASTGRVEARTGIVPTLGIANLDAVPKGVWASYRGGMIGTSVLLRAQDLSTVGPPAASTTRDEKIPTMGALITDCCGTVRIDSTLWLVGPMGTSCVAPSSGTYRAGTTYTVRHDSVLSWSPFGEWRGLFYATRMIWSDGSIQVLALRAPASCR